MRPYTLAHNAARLFPLSPLAWERGQGVRGGYAISHAIFLNLHHRDPYTRGFRAGFPLEPDNGHAHRRFPPPPDCVTPFHRAFTCLPPA